MNIEFISYDGTFPNLCSGKLTLKIDGKITTFGSSYMNTDYNGFWCSGGRVWFDKDWGEHVEHGEWELLRENLPDDLKQFGDELIKVFNDNVPHGCCGGCV